MQNKILFLVAITAFLTLAVQIIVELIKIKIEGTDKYETAAVISAEVLTVVTAIILKLTDYIDYSWIITLLASIFIIAPFVSYAAMVGYDKLISKIFDAIKSAKSAIKTLNGDDTNE